MVNIFVHKAFVSLFLQDWVLKEELISKCARTSRVVICTGKVLSRKIEPVAFGETSKHDELAGTLFNRKKNFLDEFLKCYTHPVLKKQSRVTSNISNNLGKLKIPIESKLLSWVYRNNSQDICP